MKDVRIEQCQYCGGREWIEGTVASYGGAYLAILTLRFLSVNLGFSGFAYYSWGAALLIFILYMSI